MSNGDFFALAALIIVAPKASSKYATIGFLIAAALSLSDSVPKWL